jgi:TetR/AcrR family transcriptional regulator of autoinduction and epiphytic fitness
MNELEQATSGGRGETPAAQELAAVTPAAAPPDGAALPPLLEHVRTRLRRLPRQQRSRAKVAALLAAAERLFVERGYESVTADAIAAAAGVSTGTFYAYFGDKRDALVLLLAERIDDVLGAPLADPLPTPAGQQDPRAAIRAAVARAVERGTEPRLIQLRRVWFAAARRDPELAAYERLAAGYAVARVRARLEQAAALGYTPLLDAEATAWSIWVLVDALTARLSLLGDAMPPTERMIDAAASLICAGVLAPPSAPRRVTRLPVE